MRHYLALALFLAITMNGRSLAQDAGAEAPKFPQRKGGQMSNELFGDALARNQQELRETLDRMRDMDRRYRSGEGIGFDFMQALEMGTQALSLMQQIQQLQAARHAPGLAGGKADAATCDMLRRYAQQCRSSQAAMQSSHPVAGVPNKGGTTGQAGAFNDCAQVYETALREAC